GRSASRRFTSPVSVSQAVRPRSPSVVSAARVPRRATLQKVFRAAVPARWTRALKYPRRATLEKCCSQLFRINLFEEASPPPEAGDFSAVAFDKVKKVPFKRVAHDAERLISPTFQEDIISLGDSEFGRPQLGDFHVQVGARQIPLQRAGRLPAR